MDKLQADKLTEIRERATTEAIARSSHKEYSIYDLLLDDISYLLQLVETQAQALERITKLKAHNPTDLYWRGQDAIDIALEALKGEFK